MGTHAAAMHGAVSTRFFCCGGNSTLQDVTEPSNILTHSEPWCQANLQTKALIYCCVTIMQLCSESILMIEVFYAVFNKRLNCSPPRPSFLQFPSCPLSSTAPWLHQTLHSSLDSSIRFYSCVSPVSPSSQCALQFPLPIQFLILVFLSSQWPKISSFSVFSWLSVFPCSQSPPRSLGLG